MLVTESLSTDMRYPTYPAVWAKQGDRLARKLAVSLFDGGVAWTPPGSGVAYAVRFKKPDGTIGYYDTDELGNAAVSVSGAVATVTLAQQATTCPGRVEMDLDVYTTSGTVAEHLSTFSWVVNVEAAPCGLDSSDYINVTDGAARRQCLAPDYSASSTYAVGDYCIRNHLLYRCTVAITTPEAWTAAHWTAVRVMDEVLRLDGLIDAQIRAIIAPAWSAGWKSKGELRFRNGSLYRANAMIYEAVWDADNWTETTVSDSFAEAFMELANEHTRALYAEAELAVAIDNRIKKFYTTNRNNSNAAYTNHVSDSDDGAVRSLRIYGKSSQGANPSPSNPQTIHSVVNPKLTVCGKNLCEAKCATTTRQGVTLTNLGDGKFRLNGTATNTDGFRIDQSTWSGVNNLKTYNGTYTLSRSDTSYKVGVIQNGSFSNLLTLNYGAASVTGSISNKSNCFICIFYQSGVTYDNVIVDVQLELGSTATAFAPYEANTATLAKTLNAIPVASGGNITIDGQQYIADYVDVERKKLVRCVGVATSSNNTTVNYAWGRAFCFGKAYLTFSIGAYDNANFDAGYSVSVDSLCGIASGRKTPAQIASVSSGNFVSFNNVQIYMSLDGITNATEAENLLRAGVTFYIPQAIPTEETLTDAQVADFLAMRSYYPQTNIAVTSDDLDGQATLLYPCSMERFIEFIKAQLGDERDTVYDLPELSD